MNDVDNERPTPPALPRRVTACRRVTTSVSTRRPPAPYDDNDERCSRRIRVLVSLFFPIFKNCTNLLFTIRLRVRSTPPTLPRHVTTSRRVAMSPDSPNHLNASPFHHVNMFFIAFLGFKNETHRKGFVGGAGRRARRQWLKLLISLFFLFFFKLLY
jgi:hypothetical protein